MGVLCPLERVSDEISHGQDGQNQETQNKCNKFFLFKYILFNKMYLLNVNKS